MPATAAAITIRPPYIDGYGYADVAVTITDTAGSNVTSYTANGGSTSNTYPTTISTETTFWLVSAGTYLVSTKSGEQEIATAGGSTKRVYAPEPGSGAPTLIECAQPRDVNESLSSQFLPLDFVVADCVETFGIPEHNSISVQPNASGSVMFSSFKARKSMTVNTVSVWTGGTAAGATPTVCLMGLYTVNSAGDFTRVAQTTNDTALFAASGTKYTKALDVSYSLVKGSIYAFAIIVVTGSTIPTSSSPNGVFYARFTYV